MNDSPFYQQGLIQGKWSLQTLRAAGWQSARMCLEQMEISYTRKAADVAAHPGNYSYGYADFLEGDITSQRQTLQALIEAGY
jgi:hypothetical protein